MWCIAAQEDARFVAAIEDVLEVYARPYDPKRPVICFDEASKQLLGEVREPIPPRKGQPLRYDSEYQRHGTCSLFMFFEPLAAKSCVGLSKRRTCVDYARIVKMMCEELYPDAEKIVLVQDNLNTHGPHSLYQAFSSQQARHLMERIEWHYTPRHGSWLNMAEMELSVLARQCLSERMESQHNLQEQVQAWQTRRNQTATRVHWHFTCQDARIKLRRYCVIRRGVECGLIFLPSLAGRSGRENAWLPLAMISTEAKNRLGPLNAVFPYYAIPSQGALP